MPAQPLPSIEVRLALSEQIPTWLGQNESVSLDGLDLGRPEVADRLDWTGLEQAALVPVLRVFQRLRAVHTTTEGALALLREGYTSACDIARTPCGEFAERMAPALGGDQALARRLHVRRGGGPVIAITRLDGSAVLLNLDLIVSIEQTPDTLIALTTGDRVLVRERPDELVERIVAFRRQVAVSR